MSLDSKYKKIKKFNELLISFKNLETRKPETNFRKNRIMKNVDELYEKYYNAYESDYDTDDELKEDKKKESDYKKSKSQNFIKK